MSRSLKSLTEASWLALFAAESLRAVWHGLPQASQDRDARQVAPNESRIKGLAAGFESASPPGFKPQNKALYTGLLLSSF